VPPPRGFPLSALRSLVDVRPVSTLSRQVDPPAAAAPGGAPRGLSLLHIVAAALLAAAPDALAALLALRAPIEAAVRGLGRLQACPAPDD
jgi:hypothetical protein